MSNLEDFPDVEAKLQKPSKQSAFEKQKAEAEAKRKREEAETAAAYEDFLESFGGNDDDSTNAPYRASSQQNTTFGRPGAPPPSFGGGGSHGKRHFGSGLKSGPGSLGPVPTAFGKKRNDAFQHGPSWRGDDSRGRLGFHNDDVDDGTPQRSRGISRAFDTSDDEGDVRSRDLAEEKAMARPTLRLSNLPPRTSPAVVKALVLPNLAVENVKILPSTTSGAGERKSMTAIVTLSTETPAADIDAAVSSLQNKYLGYGFYLSLHRHLSSAVSSAAASSLASTSTSHAFGAKPVPQANEGNQYQPGTFHRGFAPPTSYNLGGGPMSKTILHVPVQPPSDIKQLQLIHKVIESVLEHGPEFEALLMSRPDVQRDEKWAWIWDARSAGGVWYRWRLWEVVTGGQTKDNKKGKYVPLFEGSHAWKSPEKRLAYEYITGVEDFISDSEYNSSSDEEYEEEEKKPAEGEENEKTYLNPLDKAKLTHLLARLPTVLAKIRKGDIARITAFAMLHSSRGADEIVEMIVSNIVKPLAMTSANPEHKRATLDEQADLDGPESNTLTEDAPSRSHEAQDTSGASLVGLYVVSDIISSSATSGIRHAWRYRQLFETSLKRSTVFETLGLLIERFNWGRLRAEKWKRSVGLILSLWEGWCAFPNEAQQFFTETFENPPGAKKEEQLQDGPKKANKWKTVEAGSAIVNDSKGFSFTPAGSEPELNQEAAHLDGSAMDEDFDSDVEWDTDIDGVPMSEDEDTAQKDLDSSRMDDSPAAADSTKKLSEPNDGAPASKQHQQPRKQRMRAVDMFADSDDSDENT
ncbi:hypothetical protein F5Y16DRAFT_98816 [Xylariaceae sp. FL0255]|nr:hypothetical protein F5Y16DRAFT_98816 [Xylariaceae sp. FL0255]